MYLNEVTDEVGHAQYISNQLAILGGIPKLEPDLAPPPKNVTAMLKQDIQEETVDVQNYRRLAELAEEAGLMALKFKMEEQAAEEDEHGNEMKRLLG
ncbi:MAG: ferritin-like domain-containing protein [candidate division Zixibacteria bacterium]|nr:ferritin-like domain-containing protein [candidate division Zixibacteria bacterium]